MSKRRGNGQCCAYCRRQLEAPTARSSVAATRDHVNPRVAGGGRTVPCCRACNDIKGCMTPEQWTEFMRANPRWWKLHRSQAVRHLPGRS